MTDYRGINSLFNQQTACPACRLSNKIWRPCPRGKTSRVRCPPAGRPFTILSYPSWYPPSGACITGCTSHSAPAIFDRPPSICNFSLRGILNVRLTRYAPSNNEIPWAGGRCISVSQDLSNFSIFSSLFFFSFFYANLSLYVDNNDL